MDNPNQHLPIDPGSGSNHDQHAQIDPGTHHNDTLHAAESVGGIVTGAVAVDAAIHAGVQAIPAGVPVVTEVMQGTAQMAEKGINTPMSVGSVAAMAGKVLYETAKVAIPETLEIAKGFAVDVGVGLGKMAVADIVTVAQLGVLAIPAAIVGSAVLTTPDAEPLHPLNLDPSYGVTHTENSSVQPATPHEVSIDPGADPHEPNISVDTSHHDTNDQKILADPGVDPASIDPHMPVDPGVDHASIDQHMSVDPGTHDNQSVDQHMSVDPGTHDNQSVDQHMSVDPGSTPDNHQLVSTDPNMHNDQNNHDY